MSASEKKTLVIEFQGARVENSNAILYILQFMLHVDEIIS